MDNKNPFLEQEIDIREYFRILYERKWLIISLTIVLCTFSLIRSSMLRPVYRARAQVLIERETPRILNIEEVSPTEFKDRDYYETQYKILKSRSLAERVNKTLGGYQPWDNWGGRRKAKENEQKISDESRARALLGRVEVKPVHKTQLVEINVEDVNPKMAAKIANLWAENYISYVLDTKYEATQYASGWLQGKIKGAKANLEKSELDLQEYRKQNKIVIDSDERTSMLQQLFQKKAELEITLSENLEYYKEKHPEIIGIRSELDSVESKIEAEKEKELYTKDKEIQYQILKRDVKTNREVYEALLSRIRETEVTGGLKATNIRIIDKATVPRGPVRPNKVKDLIIAFLVGIIGGGGLAFLFNSLDQSIKTPEDIKNYIRLPALASIALPKEDDREAKPEFITSQKPYSTISEAYRSLRTSIMFTAVEHKRKTLILTSSGPQEGKTTIAINLAIVMAQAGEKTILLDCDLRQPRVEKSFDLNIGNGLTEVLAGKEEIDSVIHKTHIENLDLITCGSIPPNPSELLGSRRMDEFLQKVEERYDRIIIDSPPVLAVTDAVVLSGKVDGTIVVVKANETNRNAMLKTKEILESVQSSNLIGSILNMVETGKTGGYYYYHYYGKYGKYGQKHKKQEQTT